MRAALLIERGSAMVAESGELLCENPVAVASVASTHIAMKQSAEADMSESRCD